MPETVVCVGAVVRDQKRILLARQSPGHPLERQWTIPWGKLEAGESPAQAALRETYEEAGIIAEVTGLLGVQELPDPWAGWIGIIYLCEHIEGTPEPRDREMDAARYFSQTEFAGFNEPIERLSKWLLQRVYAGNFTIKTEKQDNPLQATASFF